MCDVFWFKQKTAYEMRISDWSSDVCSSDLTHPFKQAFRNRQDLRTPGAAATEAEETKRRTYTPHIIQPDRTTFVPIGFDVFGGWGASTTDEIENHLAKGANREKSAKRAFADWLRSEEHTSELQSLMRISYAVFCLKKKNTHQRTQHTTHKSA